MLSTSCRDSQASKMTGLNAFKKQAMTWWIKLHMRFPLKGEIIQNPEIWTFNHLTLIEHAGFNC